MLRLCRFSAINSRTSRSGLSRVASINALLPATTPPSLRYFSHVVKDPAPATRNPLLSFKEEIPLMSEEAAAPSQDLGEEYFNEGLTMMLAWNPDCVTSFQKAANYFQYPPAYSLLAMLYYGCPPGLQKKNLAKHERYCAKAFSFLELFEYEASTKGTPLSHYLLGLCYEDDNETFLKAVEHVKIAADAGFWLAQDRLAEYYSREDLGVFDEALSFKYYKLVAAQGYPLAQSTVGWFHAKGFGGAKYDRDEAFTHYKMSADAGCARGQYLLGEAYYQGIGVETNDEEAVYQWGLACAQRDMYAEFALGEAYVDGVIVQKDMKLGVEFLRRAADDGHPEAQAQIARAYWEGTWFQKDDAVAMKYAQLSSNQNCGAGHLILSSLCADLGDFDKAKELDDQVPPQDRWRVELVPPKTKYSGRVRRIR